MHAYAAMAVLVMSGAADGQVAMRASDVETAAPMDLRYRILGETIAESVVDGRIGRIRVPGQNYNATYWTPPQALSESFCFRYAYSADLTDVDYGKTGMSPDKPLIVKRVTAVTEYSLRHADVSQAEGCDGRTGFFRVHPALERQALQVSSYLVWAMRLAEGERELPFTLDCIAEEDDDVCDDKRRALAQLPLDALYWVGFETGRFEEAKGDSSSRVRIRHTIAATPDDLGTAKLDFDRSGSDGKSWRIAMRFDGSAPTHIELRRTTVIYH